MRYPQFLKKNDTIGITALSAGINDKLDEYENSINYLKSQGFNIKQTANVFSSGLVSGSAKERITQLNVLLNDPAVKAIIIARGGDLLFEILPYIDYDLIAKTNIPLMGYSDPTSFLYSVTVNCDLATFYGFNGSSFDFDNSLACANCLRLLQGDSITQYAFESYQGYLDTEPQPVKWEASVDSLSLSGRIIGGCIECLNNLFGTPYDHTASFLDRYQEDGIIWFFDVYALSSIELYLSLLKMRYMGYFNNCKAVLFSRVAFAKEEKNFSYKDAFTKALIDIPYIYNCDLGHTNSKITIVLGSLINIEYSEHKGSLTTFFR